MTDRWRLIRESDEPEPEGAAGAFASALARVLAAAERIEATSSKPFILVGEVATWLGVTPRGVRKMMDRGELPWAFLGRQRVIVRDLFLRQLAEQARRNAPREYGA